MMGLGKGFLCWYCWWFKNLPKPVDMVVYTPCLPWEFYIPGGCLRFLPSDGPWKWWAMEMMGLGNYPHPRNDGPLKRWHRNLQILNHLKVIYAYNFVPCTLRSIQLDLDQFSLCPWFNTFDLPPLPITSASSSAHCWWFRNPANHLLSIKTLWKIYGCFQK